MGHAFGAVLRRGGLEVVTSVQGRSARTQQRARDAGIVDLPDLDAVVTHADLVLSILPPVVARQEAEGLAAAMRRTGARPMVADCNAISPATAVAIGHIIEAAGGAFVDASIIGRPPIWGSTETHVYVSGAASDQFVTLRMHGLEVRAIGDEIGQASGLKMCYAAVTKGLAALATQQRSAAAGLGLSATLMQELDESQPSLSAWIARTVPDVPSKAARWVGEMEEIAATFESIGVSGSMMIGAAEFFRLAARISAGT